MPGVEAAGVVTALGEGVEGFAIGERVVYWHPLPGAFAEFAADAVGAATIEQSIAATKRRGTCVLFGAASGPVSTLDTTRLQRAGSIFFTRPGLGDHLRDHDEYERRMSELFAWHRAGKLTPHIGGQWGLEGVPDALTRMAAGQTTGKLLVRPTEVAC